MADTEVNKLGFAGATSLVVGNMIGSGIFLLPATLALYGGVSILGWLFSSIAAIVLAKVFAQLSTKISATGGPYIYAKKGFGDFTGYMVAWGYWISLCATNAAITIAMLGYLSVFFPSLANNSLASMLVGLSAIWLLTWINARGIKYGGKVQLYTTIIKVVPILLISTVGVFYIDWQNYTPFNLTPDNNITAMIKTAAITFFAFLGLECATIPAENIKDSSKTVYKSTIAGTLIAIAVYMLSSTVLIGMIPAAELQNSNAPFADAAKILFGDAMVTIVALGAIISTFGALNGWLLTQAQIPMAAARDNLFPQVFRQTNENGVPAMSMYISSVIVSLLMMMNFNKGLLQAFEFMILLSTLTALVPYVFSSLTHILLFYSKGKLTWCWGAIAFIFSMWIIIGLGSSVIAWGFIALVAGFPLYVVMKISQQKAAKNNA